MKKLMKKLAKEEQDHDRQVQDSDQQVQLQELLKTQALICDEQKALQKAQLAMQHEMQHAMAKIAEQQLAIAKQLEVTNAIAERLERMPLRDGVQRERMQLPLGATLLQRSAEELELLDLQAQIAELEASALETEDDEGAYHQHTGTR